MVRINKLILENFKSFGGKTELKFMDKLNIIIGPNGSGKSNIGESISFVLGMMSKKGLRTEKFSDIIFNGGKRGTAAKSATVKIVFSNEDKVFPVEEDFIEISRKVDVDSEGEYRINGKKTTRNEILNVLDYAGLNPEGFNMIMQGSIAKFVDMSTLERRGIIEEVSGIATYEEKKEKTLGELEKVKEKIKETHIILKEREKHLEEIKKEKQLAEKFQNTKQLLKVTKGQLVNKQIKEKEEESLNIQKKIEDGKERITKNQGDIITTEQKIKIIKEEIDALNKNLGSQGAQKQKELEDKIASLKTETHNTEITIKSHTNEIERIKDREAQVIKNLLDYDSETSKLKKEITDYDEKLKSLTEEVSKLKENASSKREVNYFELKQRINEVKDNLLNLRSEQESLIRKQESFENFKDLQEEFEQKKALMDDVLKKLENEMNLNSELALKVDQVNNKITSIIQTLERLKAQKNVSIETAGEGVKQLLEQNIPGVQGTVAQLIKVNKEYELPIRVAAGNRLLNVVVDTEDTAKKCIDFLKNNRLGVITFLPMNKIKPSPLPDGFRMTQGVVEFAINLVDFNNKYQNIFEYIFRDTLVVQEFETAKKIGIGKIRMVTVQGDLIETSGAITGGFRGEKSPLTLASAENEEKIVSLEEDLAKNQEIYTRIKTSKEENDKNIMSLREKRAGLDAEIKNVSSLIEDLKSKSEGFDIRRLEKVRLDTDKYSSELSEKEKQIQDFEKTFSKDAFEKTQKVMQNIESEINSLTVNKGIKSSRLKQIVEKDIVELTKIKKDLEKQRLSFSDEISKLKQSLENMNSQLKTYESDEKSFHNKLKENYEKRDKNEEEKRNLLIKIEEKKMHIKDEEDKINNLTLLIAEVHSKSEGLRLKFEEYKSLELPETKKSEKDLEQEVFLLEKKLETFGNVNLKSLDVYKIVEEEYNEVKTKMSQLEGDSNSIISTIDEIEKKKKGTFMEVFNEIRNNFQRIFGIISPGGIADLIVENPDSPFESGIDIKARPKGKKTLTLKSMSGGEKTITALSFIFAIQEYDPAPFYIFDEVDAALDKENATKLAKLAKQYSEKAQFLLISHNDNVISEADYLYGVSMTPDGISKVVTLKLPEQ
ncbi:Chromosome partition protein Smc [Candidatus Tiddalikarchaeum anstoanum]|nr:Chromosome partition protein Smc [Candidatus Tiddalikarchaeum anstoanum]